jgi:hypothetical protein
MALSRAAWPQAMMAEDRACHYVLHHAHRRQHPHELERPGDALAVDLLRRAGRRFGAAQADRPAVGFNAPEIRFSVVDLPDPFGPIRPMTSCSATSNLCR